MLKIILTGGLFLLMSLPSKAVSLCDAEYLSACADLNSPECINKYHACGEYKAIINHFASEQFNDPLIAAYYQGVAFYGLYLRHRAKSLKCDYASAARSNLRGYLGKMEQRFNKDGNFGTESAEHIYHAIKLYERLKNVSGCLESGLSEDDIRYLTRTYLNQTLEGLFFETSAVGALAKKLAAVRELIYSAISGFATSASKIETELALRRIELKASQRRISTIVKLYENGYSQKGAGFGKATIEKNSEGEIKTLSLKITPGAGFEYAKKKVAKQLDQVQNKNTELNEALRGQSIDEYELARARTVGKAKATLTTAVQLTSVAQTIVPSEGSPSSFKEVLDLIKSDTPKTEKIYQSIRQKWRGYGKQRYYCTTPETSAWFCADN